MDYIEAYLDVKDLENKINAFLHTQHIDVPAVLPVLIMRDKIRMFIDKHGEYVASGRDKDDRHYNKCCIYTSLWINALKDKDGNYTGRCSCHLLADDIRPIEKLFDQVENCLYPPPYPPPPLFID